jgi:tetratricopeptide (TPR) repeat protein
MMYQDWQDLYNQAQQLADKKVSFEAVVDQWRDLARRMELLLIRTEISPHEDHVKSAHGTLNIIPWTQLGSDLLDLRMRLFLRCGRCFDKLGLWKTAGSIFEQVIGMSPESNNDDIPQNLAISRLWAVATMEAGDLLRRTGKLDQALEYQERALEIAMGHGLEREQADASNNIAIILVEQGKLQAADEYLMRCLETAEVIGEIRLAGHSYNNLGVIRCMQGKFQDAISDFQRALVKREMIQDQNGISEVFHNLAMACKDLNRIDEAENYVEKALDHIQHHTNIGLESNITLTAAEITFLKQDYDYARSRIDQVIPRQRGLRDEPGMADSLRLLGEISLRQEKFGEAETCLNDALQQFRNLQMPLGEAECLKDLGDFYILRNRFEEGRKMYTESRNIYTRLGNLEKVECLTAVIQASKEP